MLQNIIFLSSLSVGVSLFSAVAAQAATIGTTELDQGFAIYQDSHERSRSRVSLGGTVSLDHVGLLSSSSYTLRGIRDNVEDRAGAEGVMRTPSQPAGSASDALDRRYHVNTGIIGATQTWAKLTETRQSFNYTRSDRDRAGAGSVGISRWFYSESLRASLDFSRQEAKKRPIELLDFDQEIIHVPAETTTNSADFAMRHLATPTMIADYKVGWTGASNRPGAWRYGVALRQFVPPLKGALHGEATRYINYGKVTTETTYGSLNAWEASLSWLQSFWKNNETMFAYRYYREDETTRALGDRLTFGSDTVSASLSQKLQFEKAQSSGREYRVIARGSRYLTNHSVVTAEGAPPSRLAATAFELGINARL